MNQLESTLDGSIFLYSFWVLFTFFFNLFYLVMIWFVLVLIHHLGENMDRQIIQENQNNDLFFSMEFSYLPFNFIFIPSHWVSSMNLFHEFYKILDRLVHEAFPELLYHMLLLIPYSFAFIFDSFLNSL